ncbi:MAG: twin-arginine translocation signal domain-containing protein, partial [Xanthobacteraceae bacterium]
MRFSEPRGVPTSRRQLLKAAAAGAAASIIGVPHGRAAAKSLTLVHESSFIKNFDAFFQQTLA